MFKRCFHTTSPQQAVRAVFKSHNPKKGIKKFDDNFTTSAKKDDRKVWERMGISKDEFFVRKYGNITPEERKKLDEKVAKQRRLREERRKHELGDSYVEKSERGPITLNPLSEYVYGTHPVISALSAGKRESFNKLYTFNPREQTPKILQLAKQYGIKVVEKKSKAEMNRLSSNGIHNGVVLETKPLHLPSLFDVEVSEGEYTITCINEETGKREKSTHELARGTERPGKDTYPLGIYLDGITDPMNFGNIVRSAYFLGVDFIVVPSHDSARIGPVTAKASAGALDMMPIYQSDEVMPFFDRLKKNGWNVVSTSAKPSEAQLESMKDNHAAHVENKFVESNDLPVLLSESPILLVLGSEGSGIKKNLVLRSDYLVAMNKGRVDDEKNIVDSLNVGTAAAMIISRCLD
ncbi:hypothetical protein FT663_00441 [Candidozyma haemuli var. vulneris]|uniref:rRNA methyltransferase 1, mitochondrial n=1 Tax=Candidozyma haemuli TaxID=45357 RepID=A0A2V1ARX4_9ASCO|nr:RNA methyltransferase, TrmH family, group 3 [[Candida] haemuloni]KAF3993418.1 hypothetical protein FT662_00547 [[Candida] haemuloni var. vulneris]KAF3995388.1 hypothetical protein FT663_00441 [[Candida] haemuloni var. vulneris]PVH20502.1 RNA methyltransferase, TrmH family, group 3 [[Candida] haemuloni]